MATTDAIVGELRVDGSSFDSDMKRTAVGIENVARSTRNLDSALSGAGKSLKTFGRGAMGQAGNVAMQVQDIAVSLQGGMNGLQVMGQQGSQLLSIFGPKGMLVGGFVAIGAAIGSAFYKSEEKFKNIKIEARDLNIELQKLAKFGHGGELSAGLSKASEQFKNLNKDIEDSRGIFASIFSLTPQWVKEREMRKELAANENNRRELAQKTIKDSKLELDILRKIADGRTEEADAMKRVLEYQQEIDKIKANPNLVPNEKERLINLESFKEIARTEAVAREKNSKEQEKIDEEKMRRQREHDEMQKKDFEAFQDLQDKRQREHDEQQKKDFEAFEKQRRDDEKATEKHHDEIRAFNADMEARFAMEKAAQDEKDQREAQAQSRDAKAQQDKIAVMEVEITKGKTAAQNLSERLKIEQDICKAREDGNKELEAGLQKEKQLLEVKDAIAEQLKTPEQKKAERDKAAEERKAARIVASRARRLAQAAANAGFGGEVKPKDKAAGVPNLNPNAPAAGAAGAAAGNQMKVDTLVVKVLKHG